MIIIMTLFIIMIIIIILLLFNLMIMKKSWINREKMSPFECGFDPISDSRLPFSIHFFLIALMFLIFDIEIVLFLPFIFSMFYYTSNMIFSFLLFLTILIFGIFLEWMEGSLKWIF